MTLSIPQQFLALAVACVLAFALLWFRQTRTKDASAVDVAWSFGLGLAGIFMAITGEGDASRRILVGAAAGFWGIRLGAHLLVDRVLKATEEDGRYQKLRAEWGDSANAKFLVFYQFQALLVILLSAPFALAAASARAFPTPLDIAAAALWLIGIVGETIADRQLARFRRNPANKGKVCKDGLWRSSRHPNYFFEWLMWCAYALLALNHPWGWIGISAPLLMLFFILKVTGVPPTEERALRSRGEAYRQYQRETSVFVPWPPKKATEARA